MPWSKGSGNLLPAIDAAQAETDCGTDRERSGIVVHSHRNGSYAFGAPVLACVGVTLPHDCWRYRSWQWGTVSTARYRYRRRPLIDTVT